MSYFGQYIFAGDHPFEYILAFIFSTSMTFWGLGVDITDAIKTGVVAVIGIIGAKIVTDLIGGASYHSLDYNTQSVYDPNQKNMRNIMGEI
jgi:hypothetical protein